MRKIAVFTGTRAEYGLLYWIIKAIKNDPDLVLQLLVTGMHLTAQFGETWREIEADGFTIDAKVDMLLASNSPASIVKSMGLANIGFADALEQLKPDLLLILGDRFEALAIAQTALIMAIPIAHIHGGELTLGAYDNAIRHAITKMASLHFVANQEYYKRIVQMGEEEKNIFNVGAPGLESIVKGEILPIISLAQKLDIPLRAPYLLITYHPVTLDKAPQELAFEALLKVLDEQQDYQLLFTYPNADNGSQVLIQMLEKYCQKNKERAFAVKSLGNSYYLSAVSHAAVVIGNSSSGIIEVPSLKVPTVNIGLRQQGRLAANSVLHCEPNDASIRLALKHALSAEHKAECLHTVNPYGDGEVALRIIQVLKTHHLSTLKHFQDLDFHYAEN